MQTCLCCFAATMQHLWSVQPLWWESRTTDAQRPPSSRWRSTTTGTSAEGQPHLIGPAILPCHRHISHLPVTILIPCHIMTLRQWTLSVHHCTVVVITAGLHLTSIAVLIITVLLLDSTVPSQTAKAPQITMVIPVLHLTVTTVLHPIMVVVNTNLLCPISAWVSWVTLISLCIKATNTLHSGILFNMISWQCFWTLFHCSWCLFSTTIC